MATASDDYSAFLKSFYLPPAARRAKARGRPPRAFAFDPSIGTALDAAGTSTSGERRRRRRSGAGDATGSSSSSSGESDNDGAGGADSVSSAGISSGNFTVAVRVRAAIGREVEAARRDATFTRSVLTDGAQAVWMAPSSSAHRSDAAKYTFNQVLGPDASQAEVFERCVRPCVASAMRGYNATVFAYGVTGSGKTYTMVGSEREDPSTSELRGVIPRAVDDVFRRIASSPAGAGGDVVVTASFLQVYNETLTDLIGEGDAPLTLRSGTGDHGVTVEGLSAVRVRSAAEAMRLVAHGARRRATASTLSNAVSSRSHAVFTLTIARTDDAGRAVTSMLNMVDLAGSERVKVSGSSGTRLGESIAINKSLFAVANVIDALTAQEGGTRAKHIPYRDSKLTRLLEGSLGGNCRTTLIATASPCEDVANETARTLRFACRATYVQNFARVNVTFDGKPIGGGRAGGSAAGAGASGSGAGKTFTDTELDNLEARAAAVAAEAASEGSSAEGKSGDGDGAAAGAGFFNRYVTFPSRASAGKVAAQAYGKTIDAPMVVMLHGYPSDSSGFEYMFPPLVDAGYRVLAIDMPGFGESPGERLSPRSEHNLIAGGPVDIVKDALDHYGVRSCVVVGYDWGGGVAVSCCLKMPKRVKKVVIYHGTYTETKGELAKVRQKTLLLWSKTDQFHPYMWARTMMKKMPNATLVTLGGRKKPGHRGGTDVEAEIVKFVGRATGTSSRGAGETAAASDSKSGSPVAHPAADDGGGDGEGKGHESSSSGHAGGASEGKSGGGSSDGDGDEGGPARDETRGASVGAGAEGPAAAPPVSSAAEAVERFRELWLRGQLPKYYAAVLGRGGDASLKPEATRLFSQLPVVSPRATKTPADMVAAGLWSTGPRGWEAMTASPRYTPGRQVMIRLRGVNPTAAGANEYLGMMPGSTRGREAFTTHRAVLRGATDASYSHLLVDVQRADGSGSVTVAVPADDVLDLNQRMTLAGAGEESGTLEDSIKVDFTSTLMRARMCEVALALDNIVRKLDFSAEAEDCAAVQKQCIMRIRRVMNITRLQDGVDRRRDARTQDVARLITYGQGHCHGLSSTMFAVLSAFGHLLGIDARYRRGYVFSSGECGTDGLPLPESTVSNRYDRHHWLELGFRPSNESFTCDLSFDGRVGRFFLGHSYLSLPVALTYSLAGGMYPNGTVPDFLRLAPSSESDFDPALVAVGATSPAAPGGVLSEDVTAGGDDES